MTCQCNQRQHEGEFDQEIAGLFDESEIGYETYFGDQEYDPELDQEFDTEFDPESELDMEVESEIHGKDTRVLVKNTKDAPFRYICNIEKDGAGICTGTLIGPQTLLTAGHCIDGADKSKFRIIPGRAGSKEPFGSTGVTDIILPAGYAAVSTTDYGILHLKDKIGPKAGYWTRGYGKNKGDSVGTSILAGALPLPAGQLKVNLSGYPADRPHTKKMYCRDTKGGDAFFCKHTFGDPKRDKYCGTFQFKSYEMLVKKISGVLHYEHDTCPAHSGSPIWVRRHPSMGGRVLIGVHIAADDAKVAGKLNRGIIIDKDMRNFIIKNTK